jgi:DNA-binding XRE family transcriptional regulator
MATPDLERLGKAVKARRIELFSARLKAAKAAGVSKDTWQRVEDGKPVQEQTYAKVEDALRWAPGSCAAVAEGREPVEVGYVESGGDVTMVSRLPDIWSEEFEEFVRQAMAETAMATSPGTPVGEIRVMSDRFVEILRKRAKPQ